MARRGVRRLRPRQHTDTSQLCGEVGRTSDSLAAWKFVRPVLRCSESTGCDVVCPSLTNKLPFEDDEFDHVHISGVARGVPENKVCNALRLYEEQRLIFDVS